MIILTIILHNEHYFKNFDTLKHCYDYLLSILRSK